MILRLLLLSSHTTLTKGQNLSLFPDVTGIWVSLQSSWTLGCCLRRCLLTGAHEIQENRKPVKAVLSICSTIHINNIKKITIFRDVDNDSPVKPSGSTKNSLTQEKQLLWCRSNFLNKIRSHKVVQFGEALPKQQVWNRRNELKRYKILQSKQGRQASVYFG